MELELRYDIKPLALQSAHQSTDSDCIQEIGKEMERTCVFPEPVWPYAKHVAMPP